MSEPSKPEGRHGLGDPRIPWVVLLDVALPDPPPSPEVIAGRLTTVAGAAGWAPPSSRAVLAGEHRELLGKLAVDDSEVLRIGVHRDGVVLAARHDALDGLAMLALAERLLGRSLRSSARGVDPARFEGGRVGALVRRAWEVAVRPPARVASSAGSGAGDSFASATIEGSPRTADLVRAGARAVVIWNDEHDRPVRRVTVAVGVSTAGGGSEELADRSAFLRLSDADQLSAEQVRIELGRAPLQPGAGGDSANNSVVRAVSGLALRLAARRLGSTLLVSHLGSLEGAGPPPAFYPVTGGGSGVSLGAATVAGRTTITLRARGAQHEDEHLQHLLALVVDALGDQDPPA